MHIASSWYILHVLCLLLAPGHRFAFLGRCSNCLLGLHGGQHEIRHDGLAQPHVLRRHLAPVSRSTTRLIAGLASLPSLSIEDNLRHAPMPCSPPGCIGSLDFSLGILERSAN